MSVTFTAQAPVTGWEIVCCCGQARVATPYATHAAGVAAVVAGVVPTCDDPYCAAYRPFVSGMTNGADAFDVNMANTNARVLLDALGFGSEDNDLAGMTTADDLRGRILLAQAIAPEDEGTPTFQEGNAVYCGRPAGYVQSRLDELTALVDYASANGYAISWS